MLIEKRQQLILDQLARDGAELRSRMLVAAKLPVLLAGRAKFGQVKSVTVANFDKARQLITDVAPTAPIRRFLAVRGVEVIVARVTS